MNGTLALSSLALVAGGLLLTYHALAEQRPSLAARLARLDGRGATGRVLAGDGAQLPAWLVALGERYTDQLRRAGQQKTLRRFLTDKALIALLTATSDRPKSSGK